MADTKVTGLTENSDPQSTDIMYIVDDPGGSPLGQKITLANLKALINDLATAALWNAAGDILYATGDNAGTVLAAGSAGYALRMNSGATAPEWVAGGRVFISEQTATGSEGTITFSSIPATYTNLFMMLAMRSTESDTVDEVDVLFNNDSTDANYRHIGDFGYGTNTEDANGADNPNMFDVPAGNSPANSFATAFLSVPFYAKTSFYKNALAQSTHRRDATTIYQIIYNHGMEWESTVAINRIDFVLASGNFAAGSVFRLYGEY